MCGPWAIPLALVAAGSGAKYFGEKQASKATWDTYNAERQRQDSMTQQQQGLWKDSLAKTAAVADPAEMAKATAAREGSLSGAIVAQPTAASYLPGSASAPAIVQGAEDAAGAKSQATSSALAHALASLGGTTDQLQTAAIQTGRNGAKLGQLASFKAGSAGVLDSEMKAAAHKGEFLRGLGEIAQQIGMSMAAGGAGKALAAKQGAAIGTQAIANSGSIFGSGTLGGAGAFL